MRRSADNKTQNRDHTGIGCLEKEPYVSRDISKNPVTETYDYTVLYYKRKNKVHKSKGVSKLDGTLTFVKSQGTSTTPISVTLRSEDEAVVYQGGMRGETGEFAPDETISIGAYNVEILSIDNNADEGKAIGNQNSLASSGTLTQKTQRFGKHLGLGSGKQARRGGLGGRRPLAGTTRKPVLQPRFAVGKKQKTSLINSENLENEAMSSSPPSSTPTATVQVSKRNTKTVLPGFKRPILRAKLVSGLSGARGRPKLLPSKPNRNSKAATGDTNNFFPGAVGTLMVPHSIRKVLRPHQVEGVVFLWNCLTGNGQARNLSPHLDTESENDEFDDEEFSDYDRKRPIRGTWDSSKLNPSPKGCILSDGM